MKTYTLDEVTDELIGKTGTTNRDRFEYDLQMDLIGDAIKAARKERKLTQEDLGKLIGVQKAQISRLENNTTKSQRQIANRTTQLANKCNKIRLYCFIVLMPRS